MIVKMILVLDFLYHFSHHLQSTTPSRAAASKNSHKQYSKYSHTQQAFDILFFIWPSWPRRGYICTIISFPPKWNEMQCIQAYIFCKQSNKTAFVYKMEENIKQVHDSFNPTPMKKATFKTLSMRVCPRWAASTVCWTVWGWPPGQWHCRWSKQRLRCGRAAVACASPSPEIIGGYLNQGKLDLPNFVDVVSVQSGQPVSLSEQLYTKICENPIR